MALHDNLLEKGQAGVARDGSTTIFEAPIDAIFDVEEKSNVLVVKVLAVGSYGVSGRPLPEGEIASSPNR